jgi:hypothetical protein
MADRGFIPPIRAVQDDLFPPEIPAVFTRSSKLRTHPVSGTAMAPTLKTGDFVLLVPTTLYQGEGVYLIGDGDGAPFLARVMTWNSREEMRLSFDAVPHAPFFLSRESFNDCVLGLVAAEIKVTRPSALRQATGVVT